MQHISAFTTRIEEKMEEVKKKQLKRRITEGDIYKEPDKRDFCKYCGKDLVSIQARHWTKIVLGYYMLDDHECNKGFDEEREDEENNMYPYVIIVNGKGHEITEREKEQYLQAVERGAKIIHIRGYVFNRLHTIVPASEYNRRNSRY